MPALMFYALLALLAVCAVLPAAAQVRVEGQVSDENQVPVEGARVAIRPANSPSSPGAGLSAVSGPQGGFRFELTGPGGYLVRAEREGFFALENLPVELDPGHNELSIELQHLREVYESIDVSYSPPEIDVEQTNAQEAINSNDIVAVPYPSDHSFNNALRIMPGAVVQDNDGRIHFNGGATDQVFWTLDGFNITDPMTGEFETDLSVDAPRSVTLSTGRYAAEYGKGAAGALAIQTGMGDNQFRYSAANFIPGIERNKGLRLSDWRPRLRLSGPIVKDRAWFFASGSAQYNQNVVQELPPGEDRTRSHRFSETLRTQVNLTNSNILHAGGLFSGVNSPRSNLGVLDPPESTIDRRSNQRFFHVKDQHYFRRGMVVEFGYAGNRVFRREIPQGEGLYILTPHGRRGNYFLDSRRWASRDQWLANAILPAFQWRGEHRIKTGVDINWLTYRQDAERTGFERRRLDGSLRRRVLFGGDGRLRQTNFESAWYIQDGWKLAPNFVLDLGLRQDWDRLVGRLTTSPRAAFGWSPPGFENTKITGGFAVLHDATSLETFSRHLDQHSLVSQFDSQGRRLSGPLARMFVRDGADFLAPRSNNWSLGLEHLLPGGFHARANYLRRRSRDGFTFVDLSGQGGFEPRLRAAALRAEGYEAVFGLRNARRNEFDSFEFTVRKTFNKKHVWVASYTRSRSVSNAALDISIDNPFFIQDNAGPTPWDAPNRLLSWGYFPLTRKWTLAYLLEWRSGFPFSVENDEGRILGALNSHRFPDFFELNVHLERKVSLLGYRWALRAGVLNLTDSQNATVVNNNMDAPDFGSFSGGTRQAFVTRIRWLGKD